MRPSLLPKTSPSSLTSILTQRPTRFVCVSVARVPSTQPRQPTFSPIRHLTTTTTRMTSLQPRFSSGSDTASAESALAPLLTTNGGRWVLAAEGEALEREFKFKTFAKTWDFMTAVSLQCKLKSHHPEWSNVFNTTFIRWTTHNPKGLSAKDIELAAICDSLAKDFGEVVEQQPEQQQQQAEQQAACAMSGLANRAAGSAGECCVPRK